MRLRVLVGLLLLSYLLPLPCQAEYRVFRLVITNEKEKTKREITSTWDPFQYVAFYPLLPDESIDYSDTWRCFEDTGAFKDYCPSPRAKNPEDSSENPPAP